MSLFSPTVSVFYYLSEPVSPPGVFVSASLSLPPVSLSAHLTHFSPHHSALSAHLHSCHCHAARQALGRSHGCRGTDSASGCQGQVEPELQIRHRDHHHPQSRACRRVVPHKGPPGGRRAQVAVGRGHKVARVARTTQAHTEGPGKEDLGLDHTHKGVQSHLVVEVHMQGGAAHCTVPQSHL